MGSVPHTKVPFWSNDINILVDDNHLTEFFPNASQTLEERLNALVRFAFYVSVVLCMYFKKFTYFAFVALVLLLTYFMYKHRSKPRFGPAAAAIEKFDNEASDCKLPTLGNPFMNFTMADYMNIHPETKEIVKKTPACDPRDPEVAKLVDTYFNNNLFRDVNDVFGKMNSQRQFFTMPWTGVIPDEAGDFKNWLYKTDKTCKETNNCLRYEDLRAKAPVFPDPTQNPSVTKT